MVMIKMNYKYSIGKNKDKKVWSCQGVVYVLVESGPAIRGVHVIDSSRDINKKGTCPIASGY